MTKTTNTVKVWMDDCRGVLTDAAIVAPADWSDWAIRRVADRDDRAVVLVDGVEYVVRLVLEPTSFYWKVV
jgi:hypothetical protein